MSRLAKNPIPLPGGVSAEVSGQEIKVKGPKGELSYIVHRDVEVKLEDGESGKQVRVVPRNNATQTRAQWGTSWSHIRNRVVGVNDGYTKELELHGVGYRANLQGTNLVLQLGYSHEINYPVPQGIKVEVEKQTQITISGIDKELVGSVASKIKSFRPPEPYKGKGVRYKDQFVLRKEGKKK